MTVRQLLSAAIVICATTATAFGQGGGGNAGGGTGGGTGGATGGVPTTGGNNTNTGSGEATVGESTDDSAFAQAIEASQKVNTDKVMSLRESGVGRVGIRNNFGAGGALDDTSGTNNNGSAGSVGAGVHYRSSQGKGRFTSTTTTGRAGAAGGTGRTAGGGIGGGTSGLNNAFGNTGTTGSLNSAAAVRIPVAFHGGASHLAKTTTPASSRMVSTRIRSLPALSQLQQAEVAVDGRVATLRGSVSSQAEKDRIGRMVKMAKGVDSVVNDIVVNEQVSPSDRQTPRR